MTVLTLTAALPRASSLLSPLDGDEAISFIRYREWPWYRLLSFYDDPNQHTLFSLLSNFTMWLFGENEASFRLPSAIAGVLAVPLLYQVTLLFLGSRATAISAALLLCGSSAHLNYSQEGRGYALTAFFALAVIWSSLKIVETGKWARFGLTLTGAGLCLTLTLPSNAFFLAGAGLFHATAVWRQGDGKFAGFDRNGLLGFLPFLLLLCLTVVYFYGIYEGLKLGAAQYGLKPSLEGARSIAAFLFSPWGIWVYLFFGYGLLNMKRDRLLPYLFLFAVPATLIMLVWTMGPPRVYIYWIPFALMLVAHGLVKSVSTLADTANSATAWLLAGVSLAGFSIQPAMNIAGYYSHRMHSNSPSLVQSRQFLDFIETELTRHTLLCFFGENIMLNNFAGEEVRERMLNVLADGQLDKMVFIANFDVLKQGMDVPAHYPGPGMALPFEALKLVKTIGPINIYSFEMNIAKLFPPVADPDYEMKYRFAGSADFVFANAKNPRLFGENTLIVHNESNKEAVIFSPPTHININSPANFILTGYAKKYGQNSLILPFDANTGWPPTTFILNRYMGLLPPLSSSFAWNIVFTLIPIGSGDLEIQEGMHIRDKIGYFDGVQSFLLYR